MSRKLVELTFKLNGSGTAYEQSMVPLAERLVDVAGQQWTIWFLNDGERLAGGIYLFEDESAADTYLSGPLVDRLKHAPYCSGVTVTQFDIRDTLTEITAGPVTQRMRGL